MFINKKDKYYNELGLLPNANKDAIKKAYRALAKKYHPDRNRSLPIKEQQEKEEKFKTISVAYKKLIDNTETNDVSIIASMNKLDDHIFVQTLFNSSFQNSNEIFLNIFANMAEYITDIYEPVNIDYKSNKFNMKIQNNNITLTIYYSLISFARHKIKKINIKAFGEKMTVKVRLNRNELTSDMIIKKKDNKTPIDRIVMMKQQHNLTRINNITILIFCK